MLMKMLDEWIHPKVEDIAAQEKNALVGGPFGSNLVSRDYVELGIPVIRGQNMGHGRWVSGEYVFVTPEKAQELSSNLARPGDIVFTQRGTLGQVALIGGENYELYIISQSQMKLTVDKSKASNIFLYYLFTSKTQQDYIKNNAIQTGVPHTNLGILKRTPVHLPPLAVQHQIADILSAFDDKIELNRQMNCTLEQMACALFKSWFVDFDPVHAKQRGEQPEGMSAETAALFPDRFVEIDGKEVPEGWIWGSIGNNFRLTMGQSPSGDTYNESGEGLPFYQGRTDFGFRFPKERVYCTSPTRLARQGSTLVSVRAPVGSANITMSECAIGRGVASLLHSSGSKSFTYYSILANASYLENFNGEGTIFGSINKIAFKAMPTIEPSIEAIRQFEEVAGKFDEMIEANERSVDDNFIFYRS